MFDDLPQTKQDELYSLLLDPDEEESIFSEPFEANLWLINHSNDYDDDFRGYKEAIERILLGTKFKNKPIS